MSDAALREVERELATAPDLLDLRRRHARLLQRAGREEQALAALDLAWRLGADELWDELQAGLAARRLEAKGMSLCYVPAGPFVMGADDFDEDARPAHLVELSAFYMAARPLTAEQMEGALGWEGFFQRVGALPAAQRRTSLGWVQTFSHAHAQERLEGLSRGALPEGLAGRYTLPTEAQWERVFRASYLRPDRRNPYGVEQAETERPEWCADLYEGTYYARSPRLDPPGPADGEARVVRGVPLPAPQFAIYRDAADSDGRFLVPPQGRRRREQAVYCERGIVARVVFLPA